MHHVTLGTHLTVPSAVTIASADSAANGEWKNVTSGVQILLVGRRRVALDVFEANLRRKR